MSDNADDKQAVQWSPRVPKLKLRRLYEQACQGIWDEALIDDVGMTLLLRCRDILNIHRAKTQRVVACPRCDRNGVETLIPRGHSRDGALRCSACGWELTWPAYQRTFKRRQLNPGGAVRYFEEFVRQYQRARTPVEKLLAIDRVVHEFHYSAKNEPERPTRPAGVNLIVGDLEDVVAFLDALSGLNLPQDIAATHADWRRRCDATYWPHFLAQRGEP